MRTRVLSLCSPGAMFLGQPQAWPGWAGWEGARTLLPQLTSRKQMHLPLGAVR